MDVLPSYEGGVVLGSLALAVTAVLISEVEGGEGGSVCCVQTIRMFFSHPRVAWLGGDLFYTRG